MRPGVCALPSAIATLALLAGCGAERTSGPATEPATQETSRAPEHPPETPAEPAESTGRQMGEGSGSGLGLVDVRVTEADRSSRIVLEFSGTGTPGWVVDYVDRAVREGSGEVVDLGAGAVLDIYASGTTWPTPDYYSGPRHLRSPDGSVVDHVFVSGTSEGYTQVLAGIDGDRVVPYRVFALSEPSRLVVEVSG